MRIEIGIDSTNPERLAEFWSEALGYRVGDMDRANTYLDLVPSNPGGTVIYFQRVPEQKSGKNRLHLDLHVENPEDVIARLVGLGASILSDVRTGSEGGWWRVLADPEGNEFCVCRVHGEAPTASGPPSEVTECAMLVFRERSSIANGGRSSVG